MHGHVHGKDAASTWADRPKEPLGGRRGVSTKYKALIEAHDWQGKRVLDVGCGSGAGTLLLASLGARAVGVDIDASVVALAAARAAKDGLRGARFVVADAEAVGFRDLARAPAGLDGVVAHLCFSEALAGRAAAALKPGGLFIVRSFEKEMWKEAGAASPFSMTQREMSRLLEGLGLEVTHIEKERRTQTFGSFAAFVDDFLEDPGRRARWQEDGRYDALKRSFARGNRTLTEAFLVLEARKRRARKAPARAAGRAPKRPRRLPS